MNPKIVIPAVFKPTLELTSPSSLILFYGGVIEQVQSYIVTAFTSFDALTPLPHFSVQTSRFSSVIGYASLARNKEIEHLHQATLKFQVHRTSFKAVDIRDEAGSEMELVYSNKEIQKISEKRAYFIHKWQQEWLIERKSGNRVQQAQADGALELYSLSHNKRSIIPPQLISSNMAERLVAYIDKSTQFKKGLEGGYSSLVPYCLTLNKYKLTHSDSFTFPLLRSNKEYALQTVVFSNLIECQDYQLISDLLIESCLKQKEQEECKDSKATYEFVFPFTENSLIPLKVKFYCDHSALYEQFMVCCKSLGMLETQAKALMKAETCLGQRESPFGLKIINPHIEVMSGGSSECERYMVRGFYEYFHYKQDGEKDEGWGCAYRSLQTLVSWFCLQNISSKRVPTIREIQELLVECGGKKEKFVGSKEWIGSIEVMSFLSSYLDIESKILSVSQGAKINEHLPILKDHFKRQGTPVMIGGGVLAYTLLGVQISEDDPNSTRFLILDPHYTGQDRNVKDICGKGWCTWKKGAAVFKKTEFYNFCLPQSPK